LAQLVSLFEFNIPFSTNMTISETKGQGWRAICMEGQRYTCNTKRTHTKTKARFSRLLRHPAWKQSGTILVEWEGMEKQENRWRK